MLLLASVLVSSTQQKKRRHQKHSHHKIQFDLKLLALLLSVTQANFQCDRIAPHLATSGLTSVHLQQAFVLLQTSAHLQTLDQLPMFDPLLQTAMFDLEAVMFVLSVLRIMLVRCAHNRTVHPSVQ